MSEFKRSIEGEWVMDLATIKQRLTENANDFDSIIVSMLALINSQQTEIKKLKTKPLTHCRISVKERLPKEGVYVLLLTPDSAFIGKYLGQAHWFGPLIDTVVEAYITHWCPITLPKGHE